MLDEKQSFVLRPKAVPPPPMFTPGQSPNMQSPATMNNTHRMPSQALVEMGMMIRKHDPDATRLHDCIGQVKVFAYNSNELRWENAPNIEGSLCAYERQQIINNKICPSYAFAIIHGDRSLIQLVTSDMVQHADKLRLFYEVARNNRREVYCIHFLTEPECLRLHTFLNRSIQTLRNLAEQQARSIPPVHQQIDPQTQLNGQQTTPTIPLQQTPTNVYRQPMVLPNSTTPQYAPRNVISRTPTRLVPTAIPQIQQQQPPPPPPSAPSSYVPQMPMDLAAMNLAAMNLARVTPTIPSSIMSQVEIPKPIEQRPFPPSPIPLINGSNNNNNTNNNSEDPTSSLKRLLNIRSQSGLENLSLDDGPVFPKQQTQQNLLDLMPPSAFEPIAATPPSPVVAIGAERVRHRTSTQLSSTMTREHFRNVLLHLVQNDDHFLDIIYQACQTYAPATQ